MSVVREVAPRLIASSFFEKEPWSLKQTTTGYTCAGSNFCRFPVSSDEMKALGEFLKSCLRANFEPNFRVADDTPGPTVNKLCIPRQLMNEDRTHTVPSNSRSVRRALESNERLKRQITSQQPGCSKQNFFEV